MYKAALIACLVCAAPATAGSHLWRFHELYSSADGTIQFIEMKECCGADNETRIMDKWIESAATGHRFVFPEHLECCTAEKFLLLATPGFAELPGAPAPDYVIEPSFFDLVEDVLSYWLYQDAVFEYGPGQLPTDGRRSLNDDHSTGVNSPTNFAGDTGSIVVACHPADLDASGMVDFSDLLELLSTWGPCDFCPADFDVSGFVDFDDLLFLLNGWGACG